MNTQTKNCKKCQTEFHRGKLSEFHWNQKEFCSRKCKSNHKDFPCICRECGNKFFVRKRDISQGRGQFCSKKCSGIWSGKEKTKLKTSFVNCDNCGVEYKMSNSHIERKKIKSHQFFCSKKCETEKRTEHNYSCPECGTSFRRMKSQTLLGFNKYCSFECSKKGQRNGEYRNCQRCKKEFYIRPSELKKSSSKFCSWECLHSESELLTIKCYNCGEDFKRYKSRLRKYNFCSKECVNEKQEFGFGIVSKSKSGKTFPSLIESVFCNILDHMNLKYKTSVLVTENRKWTCDFIIEKDNIIYWVEIDGMGSSRRNKYFDKKGNPSNEKIKFYIENNYNLFVISNKDFIGDLKEMLFELEIDIKEDELDEITRLLWKY